MSKMIQVRNVPPRLHRELKKRAKARGKTLTDYILEILEREMSRPPASEVFERIASRSSVDLGGPVAEILRKERTVRDAVVAWRSGGESDAAFADDLERVGDADVPAEDAWAS